MDKKDKIKKIKEVIESHFGVVVKDDNEKLINGSNNFINEVYKKAIALEELY